jgi:hypothetical protein
MGALKIFASIKKAARGDIEDKCFNKQNKLTE